ncbi:MAG: alpha/beta hydrolase [Verrucomicrobiales bacterium]|nr:alpha/beta hydrolase [Verrucomicrobiales bacterium]
MGLPILYGTSLAQQPATTAGRLDRENLLQFRDPESGAVKPVATPDDWQIRRAEVLAGFQKVAGNFPGDAMRGELQIEVVEENDCGSYVRKLITYQSAPGPHGRTPAYLCVPKKATADAKTPAVLCLHPTDNKVGHKVVVGLGGRANRQYAQELAERGFITISPSYPHLANYWPALGGRDFPSGTTRAIWDNSRAIDLLESMPEVEMKNGVGAIGHSLGGHNAIYSAVFDDRISVIVSSCGFDLYPDYYDGVEKRWFYGAGWCQLRYMPKMSNYRGNLEAIPFDFSELLGALAPRPVFINAPLNDSNFRWKSVDRCVAAALPVYKLLGNENGIEVEHPNCNHDFPDAMREKAYATIERVLKKTVGDE